ncbi:CAF17-like 4Fe-4S cluster assembly/insertion protein YgfZ [Hyphomicrobium sp.]|uniref:CAF17-like 4Fe-4S cluster assembly/insertion protein YgfZ n=1 Tax=Hyphomicrobium sp. TaxID=82 RepID=UPI003F72F333
MSQVSILPDRGVVSVAGADAEKLLGGLITNEMALLDTAPALHAGLLSPQGKILFDFFVVRAGDGYLLETASDKAGDLVKRLSMYKLRADAAIRDVSDEYVVAVAFGGDAEVPVVEPEGAIAFVDPRLPGLGVRVLVPGAAESIANLGAPASAETYHAHRIGLGVPEGGKDFVFGDTFPHEALMDQLHGLSFTKGCFVGQEVVSRMQHRTNVRKRIVEVSAEEALPSGPLPVTIGEAEIGRLGSVDGARGLALVRIDRVAEAQRDGMPVTVAGLPLTVTVPAFATFAIKASA